MLAAADKKKVAVFISVMGKNTYAILRDLCSLDSPKDKSFSELCDKLKDHFKPKRLEVAETCGLNHLYLLELKSPSTNAYFKFPSYPINVETNTNPWLYSNPQKYFVVSSPQATVFVTEICQTKISCV